jgi:low affinity Fe/Cu permease
MPKKDFFTKFADKAAHYAGSPVAFIVAFAVVLGWAATGPLFGFSDTWQIVINTATTIVTFLLVFLIQQTQNRDSKAVQLKLDELIRATAGTHTAMLDLEELKESELDALRQKYEDLAERARKRMRAGETDTGIPKVNIKS